jgi:SpoVK/Ycf46/Vps4 family AAA+-type ATPase
MWFLVTIFQLDAALDELDHLVGVPEVKKSILSIVESMLSNYDKELQAQETDAICLNRVFLGNPGTGKTTVAKLYARILCAAGMLSKDDVIERSASDFMGAAVGESAQKTVNILKLSEGKVLLIDEAYNLFDCRSGSSGNVSYGKQASTLSIQNIGTLGTFVNHACLFDTSFRF